MRINLLLFVISSVEWCKNQQQQQKPLYAFGKIHFFENTLLSAESAEWMPEFEQWRKSVTKNHALKASSFLFDRISTVLPGFQAWHLSCRKRVWISNFQIFSLLMTYIQLINKMKLQEPFLQNEFCFSKKIIQFFSCHFPMCNKFPKHWVKLG